MQTLEDELNHAFYVLEVAPEDQLSIHNYLHLLKSTDEATYNHSIIVGLQSSDIAEYLGLDPKGGLIPGNLHDTGKICIPPEILRKTSGFNTYDMAVIKEHPLYSYFLLKGSHDFSAEVAIRHHRYQVGGYPRRIPKSNIPFSEKTKKLIEVYATIVSLADVYNAIISRKNDKFKDEIKSNGRELSNRETKYLFLKNNPNQADLIKELYKNAIFDKTDDLLNLLKLKI